MSGGISRGSPPLCIKPWGWWMVGLVDGGVGGWWDWWRVGLVDGGTCGGWGWWRVGLVKVGLVAHEFLAQTGKQPGVSVHAFDHLEGGAGLGCKVCQHCSTDPDRTGSTETTSRGGFEPVWGYYTCACTPHVVF